MASAISYSGNASSPFVPKPAYLAAAAVQRTIGNAASFDGRLASVVVEEPHWHNVTANDVFVLSFSGNSVGSNGVAFAAWTNVSTCVAPTTPGARTPCHSGAATERDCLAAGCCFDDSVPAGNPAIPQCYIAMPVSTCPATEARVDCGFTGITEAACSSRGCCWNAIDLQGPQCYFGMVGGPVNVTFPVAPAPSDACFDVTDVFGYERGTTCARSGFVEVQVTDGPLYLL